MIVPHMINIQINIVKAKILKTLIQTVFNMLLTAYIILNFINSSREEFPTAMRGRLSKQIIMHGIII